MPEKNRWKLDRRIPATLIAALVLQIGGVLIWATTLDARVSNVEKLDEKYGSVHEKFARLEERLDALKRDTDDIKRQMVRLTDKLIR